MTDKVHSIPYNNYVLWPESLGHPITEARSTDFWILSAWYAFTMGWKEWWLWLRTHGKHAPRRIASSSRHALVHAYQHQMTDTRRRMVRDKVIHMLHDDNAYAAYMEEIKTRFQLKRATKGEAQ